MLTRAEFWARRQNQEDNTALGIAVLKSWKGIADDQGHEAADLATGVFEAILRIAVGPKKALCRHSTTSWLVWLSSEEYGAEVRMAGLLPARLVTPAHDFEMSGKFVLLLDDSDLSDQQAFDATCETIAQEWADVPQSMRYEGVVPDWESIRRGD